MDSQGASGLCSQAVVKSVSEKQLQKKIYFLNIQELKNILNGISKGSQHFLCIDSKRLVYKVYSHAA
jgi:hypothetical protein